MYASILIFMAIAFGLIYLLRMAQVGTLLAFLVAGVVVGPQVMDLFHLTDVWDFLGQLGIVFLWFTMGLELNIKRIWKMKKLIFGFGAAQVAVVVALLAPALFLMTSWPVLSIVMVALLLAMSSTSSDLQILADTNQLQSSLGRQSFSILLFQDLLSIPLLAMLPIFSGNSLNLGGDIVDILVMSVGLIVGVVIVGRLIINPILRAAARLKSREASILIILINILFWAVVMNYLGLPPAMGAFLAGMLISETMYRHQVQADIAPYQTLFLAFFFITLGMGLNLKLFESHWFIIIACVLGLMLLKFGALYLVGKIRGNSSKDSFKIALLLAQGGEFGLLILHTILSTKINVIPQAHAEMLMVVIIISMMMTPLLIKLMQVAERAGMLHLGTRAEIKQENAEQTVAEQNAKAQVAIFGFGRVGQTVAKMFETQGISYVALDVDVDQVVMGRRENYNVFYGDTSREDVLRSLGLEHIKICVLALDNLAVIRKTVRAIKSVSPRVKIFARSRTLSEADALIEQGVAVALPETIESSFILGQEVLLKLGIPETDINEMLSNFRRDSYGELATILEKNDPNYFKKNKKQIKELQHILLKGVVPPKKKTLDEVVAAKKKK